MSKSIAIVCSVVIGGLLILTSTVAASPAIQNDVKQRTIGHSPPSKGSSTFAEVPSKRHQEQQEVQKRRDLNGAAQLYRVNIPSQIKYYFDEGLMSNAWTSSTAPPPSTTTTTTTTTVKPDITNETIAAEVPKSSSPKISKDPQTSSTTAEDGDDGCTNCGQRFKTLSEPEIRQMRIDEIKGQILRKLRLQTPPNITIPRSMLPTPLMEGEIILKGQASFPSRDIEDFYGKMEQVIVMAENDVGPDPPYCQTRHYDPAACFYFNVTDDIFDRNIESAELWVYKLRDRRDRFNQTYVVSEFVRESNSFAQPKTIVAISETDVKSGWIRIDMAGTVKRWLSKPRLSVYGLQISCKTCSMNLDEIPVSYDPGEKPFIVINLNEEDGSRGRRNRRSIECTEGVSQCCRESLYVNFSEIGWNDWIVQPTGYYANYCKGSCIEDVAIPLSTSHHTTVMQVLKYYVQKKTTLTAQQKAVFAPCCTPTRMSSTSLIYQDDKQKILQNNLPNMVVESCGCY